MFLKFATQKFTISHVPFPATNTSPDLPLGQSAVELSLLLEELRAPSLLLLLHSALLLQLTELQLLKLLGFAFKSFSSLKLQHWQSSVLYRDSTLNIMKISMNG